MEQSVLAEVGLPAAVFLIMVALGLTLSGSDFRRLVDAPRPVAIGLFGQLLVLPAVGFAVAAVFDLAPVIAVSIVLLAAAPGGATSNVIVHSADGDRALSVTLTALSSLVTWITLPLLLGWAVAAFSGGPSDIEVPLVETMLQVAGITIVPVLVGMGLRRRWPDFAERTRTAGRIFAAIVLAVIIVALVIENLQVIIDDGPRFAPAFILLNAVALAAGYGLAKLARLPRIQAVTISIETGLQNSTVAITVALTALDSSEMSIVPALYGLWMLITGFGFAYLMLRRSEPEPATGA